MKSVQILSILGLAAAAQAVNYPRGAGYNATVTTEVVTAITTFCPEATTITPGNGKTYTATKSETLTITDCPCTLTKPISTSPAGPTGIIIPPPVAVGNITVTTAVVTAYTTYCPEATSVVQGNQTYTVKSATTLTITNCPCTVTYPASSTTVATSYLTTYCPSSTVIAVGTSSYYTATSGTNTIPIVTATVVPASPPTPSAPGAAGTTTAPAGGAATKTPASPSATGPVQITGAGNKVGSGIGALAVAGLALLL